MPRTPIPELEFYKFLRHPFELTPADIQVLKARDPYIGKKAHEAWMEAKGVHAATSCDQAKTIIDVFRKTLQLGEEGEPLT